jgi:hypothetical protein
MERDDCGIFQDCLVQRPLSKPLQMLVSVKWHENNTVY